MKQINLKDIILLQAEGSIHREKISDELYFSPAYKRFTSNSKLKNINPQQDGSPQQYFEGRSCKKSSSLNLGKIFS